MLWDEKNKRIRIIDTDFFVKSNDITEQQSYNSNIGDFYSEIEMELGILNGQDSEILSFLQDNAEYNELENKILIESLFSEEHTVSVTDLIKKAEEIFEQEFNVHAKSFKEMEDIISRRSFKTKREQFIDELSFSNGNSNSQMIENLPRKQDEEEREQR